MSFQQPAEDWPVRGVLYIPAWWAREGLILPTLPFFSLGDLWGRIFLAPDSSDSFEVLMNYFNKENYQKFCMHLK